jgi:hypothetical protein
LTGIIEWLQSGEASAIAGTPIASCTPLSRSLRRQRIFAIIVAAAMVTCICGFTARGFATHGPDPDHCDWTMHFTGVAGCAPKPSPIVRPVLAAWLRPSTYTAAPRSDRRLRAHRARGPPAPLLVPALVAA